MLALLAAIDLQGGVPCWTLPSPTLLVLLRRYECPVTCAQMYCGQELLSAAGVDWKGCCCSCTMRLLLLLYNAAATATTTHRFGHEHILGVDLHFKKLTSGSTWSTTF
ncbi:uncharacterized protein LOC125536679 [Triticum urartu]|uniref:uncharacterized protein LOC125536679 n=1 Tax=Triticum urartu TaxID=4572 RepID=UPI0020437F25|nr:uncharacterized protein LOC125536679 [Triticum urartu]